MNPSQNKYLKPSLPALNYALDVYLILTLTQITPELFGGETSTRFDNLLGVAVALGMVLIIFLFSYWRTRSRFARGEYFDPLFRSRTEIPPPDKLRRRNRMMVNWSTAVLFICIFNTRYMLRLSDDWNIWWSLGASAVYAAMIGALMYWHYIWKPEKEAHE